MHNIVIGDKGGYRGITSLYPYALNQVFGTKHGNCKMV